MLRVLDICFAWREWIRDWIIICKTQFVGDGVDFIAYDVALMSELVKGLTDALALP